MRQLASVVFNHMIMCYSETFFLNFEKKIPGPCRTLPLGPWFTGVCEVLGRECVCVFAYVCVRMCEHICVRVCIGIKI